MVDSLICCIEMTYKQKDYLNNFLLTEKRPFQRI